MSLDVKGSGGHMPCLRCSNVVGKKAWANISGAPGGLVPASFVLVPFGVVFLSMVVKSIATSPLYWA